MEVSIKRESTVLLVPNVADYPTILDFSMESFGWTSN